MAIDDDDIRKWLELAGPRPVVSEEATASVRAVVHDAWRRDVQRRVWRRRITVGGTALAAAAGLVVALRLRPAVEDQTAVPAATVARLVAIKGTASADGVALRSNDSLKAGASIQVAQGGSVALALEGGGEWRLDAGTAITVSAARAVNLDRGAIYVDSGKGGSPSPVVVRTAFGTVEDVGTRFEVRIAEGTLRVRVRDGSIRYDGGRGRISAGAGREIVAAPDRPIVERSISPYDTAWNWTTLAGPTFQIENQTLSALLAWAAIEGGREVRFADPALERRMATTRLHGSIEGLTPDAALAVVLPTCGLSHQIVDERVLIVRP